MARANTIQTALNAGEFSPFMDARNDIDKYRSALKRLENFLLCPHGPAISRPGFKYIGAAKYSNKDAILLPFIYSNVQAYMLEFGDQYIRFFKDLGQITQTELLIDSMDSGDGWTSDVLDRIGAHSFSLQEGIACTRFRTYSGGDTAASFYLRKDVFTAVDWSNFDSVKFWIVKSALVPTGGTWKFEFGEAAYTEQSIVFAEPTSSVWEEVEIDISGIAAAARNAVTRVQISVTYAGATDISEHASVLLDHIRLIGSASRPYEIVSPYLEAELRGIQGTQSADIAWLTHANHFTRKLARRGHTEWSLTEAPINDGPYLDENLDPIFITASATTGKGVTLSATVRNEALELGTWEDTQSTAVELFTVGSPYGAFFFTSPVSECLLENVSLELSAGAGSEIASNAKLYSVAAGSPNALLATSEDEDIETSGVKTYRFATPPTLTANTSYCIVFVSDSTDADVKATTVADNASYGSGTGAAIAGLTDSLGKDLKCKIVYSADPEATPLWESTHVGALWRIKHSGRNIRKKFNGEGQESLALKLRGKFTVDCTASVDPYWNGRVVLQKSFDGNHWTDVASFYQSTKQEFFEAEATGAYYRLYCKDRDTGRLKCIIAQEEHWGTVRIASFVSTSQVTADVLYDLGSTEPTSFWREGSWSEKRGFPTAVMFDGDRLVFGGTNHQPYTIWGSWTGDYENFSPGDTDDAPYTFTLAKLNNRICWLQSDDNPIVGTLGEEARLVVSKQAPMSQTNPPDVKIQSRRGSAQNIRPVSVGPALVFVDRSKRKLLETAYDLQADKMIPVDLTLFAEHITAGGITGVAYQQNPHSVIWAPRADGKLPGLTYYRSENVVGWHQHITDGEVKYVACIPSSLGTVEGTDELWAIVKRAVGGVEKRYIEVLANNDVLHTSYIAAANDLHDAYRIEDPTEKAAAIAAAKASMLAIQKQFFCVDSGLTYSGAATTTITGLDHLEGESVVALADGVVIPAQVVTSGEITLETAASLAHVGLPYTALLQTLKIEAGAADGTAQGRMKKIPVVKIRVLNSLGGSYYASPSDIRPIPTWIADSQILDSPAPLTTGDIEITWSGDWAREGQITLMQTQPLPLIVLGILQTVVTND